MTDIDKKKEILKYRKLNSFKELLKIAEKEFKASKLLTFCIDLENLFSQSLDQNNKAWLKRVEGLRIKKLKPYFSFNDSWNECVDKLNTSIDNLVNEFKEGK